MTSADVRTTKNEGTGGCVLYIFIIGTPKT